MCVVFCLFLFAFFGSQLVQFWEREEQEKL